MLLSRSETDVLSLEVKMINIDNKVEKDKRETCKRGNSSVCPMITSSPRSAREVAFQTFPFAGAPASTCKKPWIGDPCHLHLLHKLAVVRLLIVCLQVESATDSSVSDDRGEYLRAVDLLSTPPALPKHVS